MSDTETLLIDNFAGLPVGLFSAPVGAHTEYHYLPEAAPKGNWAVACFRSGGDRGSAWQVLEQEGAHVMAQTLTNKRGDTHPMVITGDPLWQDYRVRVRFTPQAEGRSGVAFRYQNSRCYYFFGLDKEGMALIRIEHPDGFGELRETVLAQRPCEWQAGQSYTAAVGGRASQIEATIEGMGQLEAEDDAYPAGKVGLTSDVPTHYHTVEVATTAAALGQFEMLRSKRERELDDLRAQNPRPVLWKRFSTEGFGVGRNLRFGDLTGDGQIDLLIGQMVHHGPRDGCSELSCLTAMNFDGEILWQIGEPDPEKYHLTNDVGFQIHDLDGDGLNEVVYCMNSEIRVVEGATGQLKYRAPTPESKPPADQYPHILGDCLFFCDLRGTGRLADMVIKDRYWHFWVLDDRLQPLWEGSCRTGHYPFACDVDGDGHDELAIGYALYDHDGRLLWNLEEQIPDHADGLAIVDFMECPNSTPRLLCSASDSGLFFTDLAGNVLKHHFIGHAQNPVVAKFREDLPGLQLATINFWGNQGILHFYDGHGDIYHSCEPLNMGSMCLPINWRGDGIEFFVHNPNVQHGGMFDGWGRPVVMFPDDGHPDMCNAVLDLTGDCRDEVVVWDPHEVWVYTQEDGPKDGRLYRPTRNPLCNYSNYQASVSLPAWSTS